jgi:hypothetical protein
MKPIFNKTEKIENQIRYWSKSAIINLLFTLFFNLVLNFSRTETLLDYLFCVLLIYTVYRSINALYERHQWVKALNDGLTDEFFNL